MLFLMHLHGKDGEDGKIQSFLSILKNHIPTQEFMSSMIAMNKHFSKQLFIKNKIQNS